MTLRGCFNSLRNAFLPTVVLLLVANSAFPAFYQWSTTAGSNATADPSINWAEGMSPSAVNDSARAMMARLKEWGDDMSGALVAGGTASAYTLTSNQGLTTTPANGVKVCFSPVATNALGVTLAADGGTAFPIQTPAATAIPAGSLVVGSPYCFVFKTNAWLAISFYGNPYNVPLGAVLPCTCPIAPNSNFVVPVGQAISRTTYAAYFAMVSTTFGAGDGVTTFNVPDLAGRMIASAQTPAVRITTAGSGIDGGNIGSAGGGQNVTLVTANLPPYTPSGTIVDPGHVHTNSTPTASTTASGNPDHDVSIKNGLGSTASATTGVTFSGNAQGGTSTAVNKMPPTMILQYILRIF